MASILVIDDEKLIRTLVRKVLEKAGHKVTEAADGESGISAYRSTRHDLVITDIVMPGKDGIQTISELKRDFPDVRIIAISGGGRMQNMDFLTLAGRHGAIGSLAKPFTNEDIIRVVEAALQPQA